MQRHTSQHLHAQERRPYEKRSAQARIQRANGDRESVYLVLYHSSTTDRYTLLYPTYGEASLQFITDAKTVIADAGYGSEENYVYAVSDEKEPRFEFLIPYGSYVKEQTRTYKKT